MMLDGREWLSGVLLISKEDQLDSLYPENCTRAMLERYRRDFYITKEASTRIIEELIKRY